MKKSTSLLDNLDYLGSHEITKEKSVKIKELALENMKMTGAYILISEWAKKGKNTLPFKSLKAMKGLMT